MIGGNGERSLFPKHGLSGQSQVAELPRPVPKAGEVLVKVLAAAINPSDAKNVLGKMAETTTPRVPGRDFAGRLVCGDSHWEGKAVFGTGGDIGFGRDGSHAEFVAVPVEGLVEIPPDLSYEQGYGDCPGVFHCLRRHRPHGCGKARRNRPGHRDHRVRWVGGGRVAAWKGARVLGTVRSSRDLGKRDDLAMVEWIDLESRPLPESVQELTAGKGADLILDAVGGPLFEACLESLAQRGRQIAIASAGNPHVSFNLVNFYHKEACLLGVDTLKLSPGEAAEILQGAAPGFQGGHLCSSSRGDGFAR